MTMREKRLVAGLAAVCLLAVLTLGGLWYVSKSASASRQITLNAGQISLLEAQLAKSASNPGERSDAEAELAALEKKLAAAQARQARSTGQDIYGFSQGIRLGLASRQLQVEQFQIDAEKKRLAIRATGQPDRILDFIESLDAAGDATQTWSFSMDLGRQPASAQGARFSIGLGYAEDE